MDDELDQLTATLYSTVQRVEAAECKLAYAEARLRDMSSMKDELVRTMLERDEWRDRWRSLNEWLETLSKKTALAEPVIAFVIEKMREMVKP
jgi:hypothetical protein